MGQDGVSDQTATACANKEQATKSDHSLIISDKVIDVGDRKRGKLARFDPDPDLWRKLRE